MLRPPFVVDAASEAPRPVLGVVEAQPWAEQTPRVQGTESPHPFEPIGGMVRIVNEWTGESFCRPRGVKPSPSVMSLRRRMRGFSALAVRLDLDVHFLTLTVQSEKLSDAPRQLHRFVSFLQMRFKRAGLPFIYVWVLEVQMRRLVRTGELARHWHMVIGVPQGTLPNVDYVKSAFLHYQVRSEGSVVTSGELFERWGQGQVLCKVANSNPRRYLEKYLTKLEGYGLLSSDTKLVGSSSFGTAAWPEWTKVPVETWTILGELAGRKVRLRGRRLELVEPWMASVERRSCSHGVDGVCPGGRGCLKCQQGKYGEVPAVRVLETVRSPWHVVDCEDVDEPFGVGGVASPL